MFSGLDIGGRGFAGWCNILDIMEVGIKLVNIIDSMKRKNKNNSHIYSSTS